MRYPWVNIALLILLTAQLLTGVGGLISGAEGFRWVLWLHSAGGYAIVVLLFWKGGIVWDVLKRRSRTGASRLAAALLIAIVLALTATGVAWTFAGPAYLLGFSLMTMHAALAFGLAALLAWHVMARRFVLRVPAARDRRAFLRLTGASVAGLAIWRAGKSAQASLDLPGAAARFTGSYETGSVTGIFPTVSWLFDNPAPADLARWALVIEGAVDRPLTLSYEQIEELAHHGLTATIDCTGGWYSSQEWHGVGLARLLEMCVPNAGAQSITVEAVSGYTRRFPLDEARGFLLALWVAGQPLDHGHGFPVRLVAPGRRGFEWVKWVTRVHVNETSHLWQPPLPLQ